VKEKGRSLAAAFLIVTFTLSVIGVAALIPSASAVTGTILAQFVPTGPTGNGRGMAFDGTDLYYTIVGDSNIYKIDTSGNLLATIGIPVGDPRVSAGGPLAWDGSALWTMDYSVNSFIIYRVNPLTNATLSSFNIATQNPAHPAVTGNPRNIGEYPDGLAWTGSTLWVSSEVFAGNWVVEVDTSGNILSAFNPPVTNGFGTSGVAFDGFDLWHSNAHNLQYQTDVTGVLTSVNFTDNIQLEDLAYDVVTFAPLCAIWANEATGGSNRITAYEVPCGARVIAEKDFRYTNVDFTPYELHTYTQIKNATTDPGGVWEVLHGVNDGIYNIHWNHTFPHMDKVIVSATLEIWHWDVEPGEDDELFVDNVSIGYLMKGTDTGQDNKTTIALPDLTKLDDGIIDVNVSIAINWFMYAYNSTLTVEYVDPPAELGELLPMDDGNYTVDVVVDKKGKVKSTNPGQLYGVINITANVPVSQVNVTDTFGEFFDVNPAKLGGGVEILVVDEDGYATVLTDQPGITCTVNNTANEVILTVDLDEAMGGPLQPGDTLMVYIKFQTAMKHETYGGDDSFVNNAIILADGLSDEVSASIWYSEK
jgi:hypothetical protein